MPIFLIKTLQFILAITLLVFLHEGGHFLFAKLFKTRVSRFYVFANWHFHLFSSYDNWFRRLLGKPLVTERDDEGVNFFQRLKNAWYKAKNQPERIVTKNAGNKKFSPEAGTEYGIGWLPIGGYCQIDGMVDETQTAEDLAQKPVQPWEFRSKKAYQRLLIMAGGVMVNFVLALFIYSMVLFTWGEQYIATSSMTHGMKFNAQATALGFQDHDILLGTEKGDFKDFSADLYRDLSVAHECRILRDGTEMTIQIPGDLNLLEMMKSTPSFVRPFMPIEVDSIAPGSPAAEAGLKKGDRIVYFSDREIDSYNEFSDIIASLKEEASGTTNADEDFRTRTIVVEHADAQRDTLSITLTTDFTLGFFNKNVLASYEPTTVSYSFLQSLPAGVGYGWNVLGGYVSDMKYVFTSDGAKSLGGFGTIGSLFPAVWDWHVFWLMTAFLSIILAFMNILPIPGLDGGHILFLLVEVVTRRQPSLKFMQAAQNVGMWLLLILMVVANLNDILRWIGIM